MNKKVVHLTSVHPSNDVRIYEKELTSLQQEGYQCFLVCLNQKTEVTKENIQIISVSSKSKKRIVRALLGSIKVVAKGLQLHGDIYHIHDPELLPWAIFLKLFGKKIVYDVHENYAGSILSKPYLRGKSKKKLISVMIGVAEKFFARFYDLIIVVTPDIGKPFDPKKTVCLQNFPLIYFSNADVNQSRSYNLIYAGGLTRIRGVEQMIKMTSFIPDKYNSKLILAGKFESIEFEKTMTSLSGWKNIIYLGWRSRKQLNKLFLEAFAGLLFFHPVENHMVCQPNKLFEYLSFGLPVIATNFDHWKNINKDTDCIRFVDPFNPKAVGENIVQLFDEKNIETLRRKAVSLVLTHYTWETEKQKLFDAYKILL